VGGGHRRTAASTAALSFSGGGGGQSAGRGVRGLEHAVAGMGHPATGAAKVPRGTGYHAAPVGEAPATAAGRTREAGDRRVACVVGGAGRPWRAPRHPDAGSSGVQ